jgi:preprotein translocase subunit YajC
MNEMLKTVLFLGVMVGIFYFLLIRPQQKRAKEHKDMVSGLDSGDEVITSGGIVGKISEVKDNYIDIQIADNVTITVQKSHVTSVLPKGTMKSI